MAAILQSSPIWLLALVVLVVTIVFARIGSIIGSRLSVGDAAEGKLTDTQEGYVVASVYALLGLLVGFTFSVAVERYQLRRQLVVQDANAIETVYLKAQLLDEPYRSTFSKLLLAYGENHLELSRLRRDDARSAKLVAKDTAFRSEIWAATIPAFQSIKTIDFSSTFVDSVSDLMNVDAERHAARRAEIPTTILVLLIFYSLVAATVLGSILRTRKGQQISMALIGLNVLALMLVADINRPVEGTIHESQEPMERMLARLKANPPVSFQRAIPPTPR